VLAAEVKFEQATFPSGHYWPSAVGLVADSNAMKPYFPHIRLF